MAGMIAGRHSFFFDKPPVITAWASAAGKKEAEGPLRQHFDIISNDPYWGQKTWEQGEEKMQRLALAALIRKAGCSQKDLDAVFSGDLLNQCIGSSFSLRNSEIPHLGLYGACSTMAESLVIASMAVGGGFRRRAVALTSSHFASAERQYRFPLGYGGQRTPTAQWTVTGAGAALICPDGAGAKITGCTIGSVTDFGVLDSANMGAAMAPAAYRTLMHHFRDFHTTPSDYDLIITGDLGKIGFGILTELAAGSGFILENKLVDCGMLIYDWKTQDIHAGGSGCGCSAITLCGYLLDSMKLEKWDKILFCGTGALLSPLSIQQKQTIPGICHCVVIERNF